MVIDDESALARNLDEERRWIMDFTEKDIPVIAVLSKRERLRQPVPQVLAAIRAELGEVTSRSSRSAQRREPV